MQVFLIENSKDKGTNECFKVTYGISVTEEGILVTEQELSLRNITVNIGCSCSYFVPIMFQDVNLVEEKRKRRRR